MNSEKQVINPIVSYLKSLFDYKNYSANSLIDTVYINKLIFN